MCVRTLPTLCVQFSFVVVCFLVLVILNALFYVLTNLDLAAQNSSSLQLQPESLDIYENTITIKNVESLQCQKLNFQNLLRSQKLTSVDLHHFKSARPGSRKNRKSM